MTRTPALALLFVLLCCAGPSARGPYEPLDDHDRDSLRAQELTQRAVSVADQDADEAERLLREALTADLYYGPAHNDLGVLKLRQGSLYEAANEFEWARKLLPGHPDPRFNLALTLERAGHVAEAFSAYEAALEVAPEHVPTMQAYASLAVRQCRRDERTAAMIKTIALRGESETWRQWAREQVAKRR